MSLPRFIARRYLFSPQSRSVVNLISGLSVVAVAVPVAAMIILMSVFNGFEELVKSMYSSFDAELTVAPREGTTMRRDDINSAALRRIEGVREVSFVLEQSAMLEHKGHQNVVTVRGVDDNYGEFFPLENHTTAGEWRVRRGEVDYVYIGQAMAHSLAVRSLADARIDIYALKRSSFSSLLPMENYIRRTVDMSGVFSLDMDSEESYALTSLRLAEELFNHEGRASKVMIALDAGADAANIKKDIQQIVGNEFEVLTHDEQRASFYRIMRYEKWGIFFIALMVLVVASFSVVGALSMLIVEKQRDIATLSALGASTPTIRSIFRNEGLLICGLGGLAGMAIGVALTLIQQNFGIIEIPSETFITKHYPVEFQVADLAAVVASFMTTSTILAHLTVHGMIKNRHDNEK